MDKESFSNLDREYQKDLAGIRKKIEEELKKEGYNGYRFTNPEAQATDKINRYPYTPQEKERAKKAQEEALEHRRKLFEDEVSKRLDEPQKQLEQMHFGEHGRAHVLEQLGRENQIEQFKERQRSREAMEREKNQVVNQDKAKEVIQGQKTNKAPEQDNSHSVNVRDDFNKQHRLAETRAKMNEKVQSFKDRRRTIEASEREKSSGNEHVSDGNKDKATKKEEFVRNQKGLTEFSAGRSGNEFDDGFG